MSGALTQGQEKPRTGKRKWFSKELAPNFAVVPRSFDERRIAQRRNNRRRERRKLYDELAAGDIW